MPGLSGPAGRRVAGRRVAGRFVVRRIRHDQGAVATVVSILLAGGVLLGFLALVVDLGQIYVEREELQSGADAAVLAVAKACANDLTGCANTDDIRATAQRYANLNASDASAAVTEVCGRLAGKLPDCGDEHGNLTDCLGTPPAGPLPYIQIRLGTQLPDSRFVLPPTLAQTLAGNATYTGTAVSACARATWLTGLPSVLAMTVSTCEVSQATGNGQHYAPAPPYPPDPLPAQEHVVSFLTGVQGGCGRPAGSEQWQEAGPAGFLDTTATACQMEALGDGQVWGRYLDTADQLPPSACEQRLANARASAEVVYLPVHDVMDRQVHDGQPGVLFRATSLVPFVVTGYYFGAEHAAPSWLTDPPQLPCRDHHEDDDDHDEVHRCVSGLVVGAPIPLVGLTGGAIVRLVG